MAKRKNSVYYLQIASQILFLLLFTGLMVTGKIQVWMGIFLLSLVLALFFGRFYCGWICPIRTVQRVQTAIKKKLRIKENKGPAWMRTNAVRYAVLAIFILLMGFVLISGKKLPVLPAIFITGVGLTFFFSESIFHRWLCPYGTLLRIPASASRHNLRIGQSKCIRCGLCGTVCPSDAIETFVDDKEINGKNRAGYTINKAECLLCLECELACPPQVIDYNKDK